MSTTQNVVQITARKFTAEDDRLLFLPSLFGMQHMILGELLVFNWMSRLCESYKGGFWEFYSLSNGGFYMAPNLPSPLCVQVDGNGFRGDVTAETAGIIATTFALNQMIWEVRSEHADAMYHKLLDYALHHHPEAALIYRAID